MRTFTRTLIAAAVLLTSGAQAQICMLPGRTPYSGIQPGISNFKLNTINRTSAAVESMSVVVVTTNDTTTLLRGHTYTVTMTHTRDSVVFPTVRNNIRVWVDYNNNSSFDDAGETVISADLQTYGVYTNTFTVPVTATLGLVHLRATAKMSSEGGHTIPTSCDIPADPIGYHGEMEDYMVKIAAPTAISDPGNVVNKATIYPNPTAGTVTVLFDEVGNEPVSIDLFDVTGKLVGHLLNVVQSTPSYTFDLNNHMAAQGVYFIRISSPTGNMYHKIVKVNL